MVKQAGGGVACGFFPHDSPIQHIRQGFEQLLQTSNAGRYRQAFRDGRLEITANMARIPPGCEEDNFGRTFIEQDAIFIKMLDAAVEKNDWSFRAWIDIVSEAPFMFSSNGINNMAGNYTLMDPIEAKFIDNLIRYLGHDSSYSSPRGIINEGGNILVRLYQKSQGFDPIPEPARPLLLEFAHNYPRLRDYQRDLPQMGEAFFAPKSELALFPQITGGELAEYARMFAFAFGLRFLSACFTVTTEPLTAEPQQNTVVIFVDPNLRDMRLPLMLVLPKLACDIKNVMRVDQDKEKKEGQASLVRLMRGEAIEQPVVVNIHAARINAKTWELKVYDNGRGIIVEELFKVLVAACRADKNNVNVSPELKTAALDWEAGDAFVFNDIPYGHLLEAVFLHGVSGAKPGKGSGMGLWGSAALLTKLGGQIKVGVTPGGGFYQSIILPIDCSVPPEAVAQAATRFWLKSV